MTLAAIGLFAAAAPASAYTHPQDISVFVAMPHPTAPLNYATRVVPCVDGRETKVWINGLVLTGRCNAKSLEVIRSVSRIDS